ncbi:hypothetical protein PanWU01x14_131360 [Parasponia andersonii]|uniref:Transmembrane protein n=1 Tax=Parasponia andersonii TaxID=3476 RepID=A0A2P5CR31_PARAD|nr:hypothetical protein PanWU01x14_131360 [Parasponia andersonii]
MAIGLVRSFRTKRGVNYRKYFKNYYNKSSFGAGLIGLYGPKQPKYSRAYKLLARFMFLTILLAMVSFGTGSNLFMRLPSSILDGTTPWASPSSPTSQFMERKIRLNGVVAFQLKEEEHHYMTQKPSNYEIVYLRRFNKESNSTTTHVAMRKTGHMSDGRRRLLGFGADEQATKKAALEKLKHVLLCWK